MEPSTSLNSIWELLDSSSLIDTFEPYYPGQNLTKRLELYLIELISLLNTSGLLIGCSIYLELTLLLTRQFNAL
jgi:hypothetical protein